MNTASERGMCTRFWAATRSRPSASKPSMYSSAVKNWPRTSPKSNTWTIFGWVSCAVSFASSMNIATKFGSAARWGRIRFTTRIFSKPCDEVILARNTSAMPPTASCSSSV